MKTENQSKEWTEPSVVTVEKLVNFNVVTPFNYEFDAGREIQGISLTVPDESMNIREILKKHTQGIAIPAGKVAIWDDEETSTGVNPKTLDLVDIEQMSRENMKLIKEKQLEMLEAQKKKNQREFEKMKETLRKQIEAEKAAEREQH